MDSEENWRDDLDWDYWNAQLDGFKEIFKKPTLKEFIASQKEALDKVYDFFWSNCQ